MVHHANSKIQTHLKSESTLHSKTIKTNLVFVITDTIMAIWMVYVLISMSVCVGVFWMSIDNTTFETHMHMCQATRGCERAWWFDKLSRTYNYWEIASHCSFYSLTILIRYYWFFFIETLANFRDSLPNILQWGGGQVNIYGRLPNWETELDGFVEKSNLICLEHEDREEKGAKRITHPHSQKHRLRCCRPLLSQMEASSMPRKHNHNSTVMHWKI